MREIEIKVRVKDVNELISKLQTAGLELSQPVVQHDDVFSRGDKVGSNGSVFIRVRRETRNGKATNSFTLKRMVDGHGDKIEFETEITNPNAMLGAIYELGLEPYVTVKKSRRTAKADDYEICLDDVEGLGSFIEIEKIVDNSANHEEVMNELWQFAEKLGLSWSDCIDSGYDVMLREKM